MVGAIGTIGVYHHAAGIEDGAAIAELMHFDLGDGIDNIGAMIGLGIVQFGQRLEAARYRLAQGLVANGAVGSQATLFLEGFGRAFGGIAEEAIDGARVEAGVGEELLPFGDIVAVGVESKDTHGGLSLQG